MRLNLIAGLLAASLAATACAGDGEDSEPGNKLRVVSTIAPITSLVENIGGAKVDLRGLVPENGNPHAYELTPSDLKIVSEADLIVLNGLRLEEPARQAIEANRKDGTAVLALGDLALTPAEYRYSFSYPESAGAPNPHTWLDPTLAMEYASLIHEKLVELDGDNADYYDANLAELTDRLETLDQQIRVATRTVPETHRRLLTYHDSWVYWADRYSFAVVGTIQSPDFSEPSPSRISEAIDLIGEQSIPAIFGSADFPTDVLETIAGETGAAYAGDLSDDDLPGEAGDSNHSYLGLMVENMRIMIAALGGSPAPLNIVETGLVFEDGPSTAGYPQ